MTPSGLMIIVYPPLLCIILGAALLCTLVVALWLRRLARFRFWMLVLVFIVITTILVLWLYLQFHVVPMYFEVIHGLD